MHQDRFTLQVKKLFRQGRAHSITSTTGHNYCKCFHTAICRIFANHRREYPYSLYLSAMRTWLFLLATILIFGCQEKKSAVDAVMQLKELSELATVEYTITKIIKASDDQTWYKIGDRKILMSCQATVKAGIDLSQLKSEDVSINGDEITLTLPRATIQSLNIKPEDIRTEFQEVGLFRSDFTAAERNQLMAQGEAQIRKNMASTDILRTAESNASLFIGQFLRQLGYQKVDIRFGNNVINPNLN